MKAIKKRWEDAKEIAIENERRRGIQNVISTIIWLVIVVPLFVVHWGLAGKLSKASV